MNIRLDVNNVALHVKEVSWKHYKYARARISFFFIFAMVYDKSKEMEQQAWVATKYNEHPALAAVTGLIASSPIPKVFASNAVPLLIWREHRQEKRIEERLAGRM